MNNRLAVSTRCPSCGAQLDYIEGNNAVQCEYCRRRLLLTGRHRILTYYLPPAITTEKQALGCLKKALMAGPGPRKVIRLQLCFLPFYRLTGHDFIWRRPSARPKREAPEGWEGLADLESDLESGFFGGESQFSSFSNALDDDLQKEIEFQERYVEKNFVALDLPGLGVYSLGVRASVMTLHLFDKDSLQSVGSIVSPNVSPESAFARGLELSGSEEIRHRQVLARVLSVIYFPFWIAETAHRAKQLISIIDGVTGTPTRIDLPGSVLDYLQKSPAPEVETVGFLPMTCPQCGWELSGHSDGVLFYCAACLKAWLLDAGGLAPMASRIVGESADRGEKIKHLPFWAFRGEDREAGASIYIPAFRYRRLKSLHDTARQMFRRQPEFQFAEPFRGDLEGCFYDCEDARLLAAFMLAGIPEALLSNHPAVGTDSTPLLIWFPFRAQGANWINPFTGTALQSALLT